MKIIDVVQFKTCSVCTVYPQTSRERVLVLDVPDPHYLTQEVSFRKHTIKKFEPTHNGWQAAIDYCEERERG